MGFNPDLINEAREVLVGKTVLVYKCLNGLVPEYLSSKFVKRNEMRYSLRDSDNKLVIPALVIAEQFSGTAYPVV